MVIWPFLNIFLKFHLSEYFILQNIHIGDTCDALWRRIEVDVSWQQVHKVNTVVYWQNDWLTSIFMSQISNHSWFAWEGSLCPGQQLLSSSSIRRHSVAAAVSPMSLFRKTNYSKRWNFEKIIRNDRMTSSDGNFDFSLHIEHSEEIDWLMLVVPFLQI